MKIVQITAAGAYLFALDDEGNVLQYNAMALHWSLVPLVPMGIWREESK
jgi:hypothetical protein